MSESTSRSLEDLGPIRFSQRGSPLVMATFSLLVVAMTATVVWLWSIGRPPPDAFERLPPFWPLIFGAGFLLFLTVAAQAVAANTGTLLICHEHGLRLRQGLRWQTVFFDTLVAMRWGHPRRPGEQTSFALSDRDGRWYCHFLVGGGKANADMLRLRSTLARHVARHLERRIGAGETVAWSTRGEISSLGVTVHRRRFVGRPETIFMPWQQLRLSHDSEGNALVHAPATITSHVLEVEWRGSNFHPGVRIIQQRCSDPQAVHASAGELGGRSLG